MTRTAPLALALSLLFLAACVQQEKADADGSKRITASRALWGQSITLTATGHPKAEITAEGDFIVDGRKVQVDDAQRALLVAYHHEMGGIADAGIATGKEGVKLAGKAVGAAVRGVFSGKADQIDKEIEAETRKIEAEALKICDHLPALYKAQQDLATALPAFQPYASMDEEDAWKCRSKHDDRQADDDAVIAGADAGDGAPVEPEAPVAP